MVDSWELRYHLPMRPATPFCASWIYPFEQACRKLQAEADFGLLRQSGQDIGDELGAAVEVFKV